MAILGSVLIVDDEEEILEAVSHLLSPFFGEVLVAKNGVEALVIIEKKDIDAIVSDLTMPEMNGITLLKTIRARGQRIPFVIVTGNGDEATVLDALRLDAFDYIDKPFRTNELVNTVRKAVEIGEQMRLFKGAGIEAESLDSFYNENKIASEVRLRKVLSKYRGDGY